MLTNVKLILLILACLVFHPLHQVTASAQILEALSTRIYRGWLGVAVDTISMKEALKMGIPDTDGALITAVVDDSPAARAGLLEGDVIREINNKKVSTPRELESILSKIAPDKVIQVTVLRNRELLQIPVKTAEMPFQDGVV